MAGVEAGGHIVLEAYAGTGKTHTLRAAAAAVRGTCLYLAFNRAVVDEAKTRMPPGVRCATVHEMAYRSIGEPWTDRIDGPNMKSIERARLLGLDHIEVGGRLIEAGFLAGLITRALRTFAKSGDPAPLRRHVPVPRAAREDPELLLFYRQIVDHITPILGRAWTETIRPDSPLPLDGNMVIKMWAMTDPILPWDLIMVDEAQDMNGAMRSVVEAQMHRVQVVAVGDSRQQVNAWNGSINALERFPITDRYWLTKSWRFGPRIAEVANIVLADLEAPYPLIAGGGPSTVEPDPDPRVVLARTNAEVIGRALEAHQVNRTAHIVGGARGNRDVIDFCESAIALQQGHQASHPALVCFDSWADALAYAHGDELGGDIAPMIRLIGEFGAVAIINALRHQPAEEHAELVLSTVHKIKGREWPTGQIAGDFSALPGEFMGDPEELRLLYVAATRFATNLDPFPAPYFADLTTIGAP